MKNDCRVFVSYRSTNANEVRSIVDVLRSHGLDVWFAEYEVLAGNYDDFEAELDEAIKRAIDECNWGIVCTNRSWASSSHCRDELKWLLYSGKRLIRMHMPREDIDPELEESLADAPALEHQIGGYPSSAKALMKIIAPDLPYHHPPVLSTGGDRTLTKFGYGIQIALGQYQYRSFVPLESIRKHYEGKLLYQFTGTFEEVKLNLLVTLVPPTRLNAVIYPKAMSRAAGNREHYQFLRMQANTWHSDEPQDERGLHLLLHGGKPRLGMTYLKHDHEGFAWHRMYILHIGDEESRALGEVHLSFGMPCDAPDDEEYRRFLRITPCLDEIAGTLRYRGWNLLWRFSPYQWLLAGLFIFGCIGALLSPSCHEFRSNLFSGNWNALFVQGDIERGESLLRSGRFKDSLPHFDKAIQFNSKSDKAYSLRCLARAWSGDTKGAIEDGTKAIELNPSEAENWTRRAVARFAAEQWEASLDDWKQVFDRVTETKENLPVKPLAGMEYKAANACAGRAAATLLKGDSRRANRFLAEAMRIWPKYDFEIWQRLAPDHAASLRSFFQKKD